MTAKKKGHRLQFRIRTVLLGTMWLALILAICVNHQQAASRHRASLQGARAGMFLGWSRHVPPSRSVPSVARPAMAPPAVSEDGGP